MASQCTTGKRKSPCSIQDEPAPRSSTPPSSCAPPKWEWAPLSVLTDWHSGTVHQVDPEPLSQSQAKRTSHGWKAKMETLSSIHALGRQRVWECFESGQSRAIVECNKLVDQLHHAMQNAPVDDQRLTLAGEKRRILTRAMAMREVLLCQDAVLAAQLEPELDGATPEAKAAENGGGADGSKPKGCGMTMSRSSNEAEADATPASCVLAVCLLNASLFERTPYAEGTDLRRRIYHDYTTLKRDFRDDELLVLRGRTGTTEQLFNAVKEVDRTTGLENLIGVFFEDWRVYSKRVDPFILADELTCQVLTLTSDGPIGKFVCRLRTLMVLSLMHMRLLKELYSAVFAGRPPPSKHLAPMTLDDPLDFVDFTEAMARNVPQKHVEGTHLFYGWMYAPEVNAPPEVWQRIFGPGANKLPTLYEHVQTPDDVVRSTDSPGDYTIDLEAAMAHDFRAQGSAQAAVGFPWSDDLIGAYLRRLCALAPEQRAQRRQQASQRNTLKQQQQQFKQEQQQQEQGSKRQQLVPAAAALASGAQPTPGPTPMDTDHPGQPSPGPATAAPAPLNSPSASGRRQVQLSLSTQQTWTLPPTAGHDAEGNGVVLAMCQQLPNGQLNPDAAVVSLLPSHSAGGGGGATLQVAVKREPGTEDLAPSSTGPVPGAAARVKWEPGVRHPPAQSQGDSGATSLRGKGKERVPLPVHPVPHAEETGQLAVPLGIFMVGLICSGAYTNTQIHVEDLLLMSININIFGAPKVWWWLPQEAVQGFKAAAECMTEGGRGELYTKSISPFLSDREFGMPEHIMPLERLRELGARRTIQMPGMGIWTMPGYAFHFTTSMGLNVAESANMFLEVMGWTFEDLWLARPLEQYPELEDDMARYMAESGILEGLGLSPRQPRHASVVHRQLAPGIWAPAGGVLRAPGGLYASKKVYNRAVKYRQLPKGSEAEQAAAAAATAAAARAAARGVGAADGFGYLTHASYLYANGRGRRGAARRACSTAATTTLGAAAAAARLAGSSDTEDDDDESGGGRRRRGVSDEELFVNDGDSSAELLAGDSSDDGDGFGTRRRRRRRNGSAAAAVARQRGQGSSADGGGGGGSEEAEELARGVMRLPMGGGKAATGGRGGGCGPALVAVGVPDPAAPWPRVPPVLLARGGDARAFTWVAGLPVMCVVAPPAAL